MAKTEVKLVEINQRRFLLAVEKVPHFALEVMAVLVERLREMTHTHDDEGRIVE